MGFNQANPNSPSLELLGHSMARSSSAQKYKKAHHNIYIYIYIYNEKLTNALRVLVNEQL